MIAPTVEGHNILRHRWNLDHGEAESGVWQAGQRHSERFNRLCPAMGRVDIRLRSGYGTLMATMQQITTAKQLLRAAGLDRCELIRGELIMMTPAGFRHGRIACAVAAILREFVQGRQSGVVTGAETGFLLARDPDTVRAPDVAFVGADRIPETEPVGFFPGAPDLAVEVLSPNDAAGNVLAKVQDWLNADCRAVWVVDPQTRTVTVYRTRREISVLTEAEMLDGSPVLPGFQVRVGDLLK